MKKLTLLFIFLFIVKVNYAQHLAPKWADFYLGTDSIQDEAVAVDADNCIYTIAREQTIATLGDLVLIKYTSNGQREWVTKIDNNGGDETFTKIITGQNCAVYVVYYSNNNYYSHLGTTGVIVKYDSLGNNVWTYEYNAGDTLSYIRTTDFEVDANNNLVIIGSVQSNSLFSSYQGVSVGNFALKLSETGTFIWQNLWVGNNLTSGFINDLTLDINGNLFIVGDGQDSASAKSLIYKIDSNGNLVFEKTINTAPSFQTLQLYAKIAIKNNKIYLGSTIEHSVNIAFAVCDMQGNVTNTWSYNVPNSAASVMLDWILDATGNIVLTGANIVSGSDYNSVTMSFDTQGNVLWQHVLGGQSNIIDAGIKIKADSQGNYVVAAVTDFPTKAGYTIVRYNNQGALIDTSTYTTDLSGQFRLISDLSLRSDTEIFVTGAGVSAYKGNVSALTVKFGKSITNNTQVGSEINNPYILTSNINPIYSNFDIKDTITWVRYVATGSHVSYTFDSDNNNYEDSIYKIDVLFKRNQQMQSLAIYKFGSKDTLLDIPIDYLNIGDTILFKIYKKTPLICNTCHKGLITGTGQKITDLSGIFNCGSNTNCGGTELQNGNLIPNPSIENEPNYNSCVSVGIITPLLTIHPAQLWRATFYNGASTVSTPDVLRKLCGSSVFCNTSNNAIPVEGVDNVYDGDFCLHFFHTHNSAGPDETETREFASTLLCSELSHSKKYVVKFRVKRICTTGSSSELEKAYFGYDFYYFPSASTAVAFTPDIPKNSSSTAGDQSQVPFDNDWHTLTFTFTPSLDGIYKFVVGPFGPKTVNITGGETHWLADGFQLYEGQTIDAINPSQLTNGYLCAGNQLTIGFPNGSPVSNVSWTSSPSGSYPTGAQIIVNPPTTTIYTATYTNASGCTYTSSFTVKVKPKVTGTISGDPNICSLHPSTMLTCVTNPSTPPSGTSFQWYKNGVALTGTNSINYFAITPGSYYCVIGVSNANYCGNYTTNAIQVVSLGTAECCLYFANYDKINYTAGPSNPAPWNQATQTWTASSNPFNTASGGVILIRETITIPSGVNITIKGLTFKFSPRGKIFIQNGATQIGGRLNLKNNSVLTSYDACGPIMWQGIEVEGTIFAHQANTTASKQGWLDMDNSTISNAWNAITLFRADYHGQFTNDYPFFNQNIYTLGGTVTAKNSTFTNNYIDVRTGVLGAIYNNKVLPNGAINNNICNFKNCVFQTTALLQNTTLSNTYQIPYAHIYNLSTKNIEFNGCDFVNSYGPGHLPYNKWGFGIVSSNAQFRVNQINPNDKSSFNNLYYGIYTVGTTSTLYPFQAMNSTFTNCKIGIYASGINNFEVSMNSFKIYNETSNILSNAAIGVSFSNCTGYKIEENSFTNIASIANTTFGIMADNSGLPDNLIYRNNFTYLFDGIRTQRSNGDQLNKGTGLRIKCNTYQTDHIGSESNLVASTIAQPGYIAVNQGYIGNNSQMPAGNAFMNHSPLTASDFRNQNNSVQLYYVYHNGNSLYKPMNYVNVNLSAAPVTFVTSGQGESCPSTYTSGNSAKLLKQDMRALNKTINQLNNTKPKDEEKIAFLKAKKQFIMDEIIRDYLLYTDYPNALDSIKEIYLEFPELYQPIDVAQTYSAKPDNASALQEVNNEINLNGTSDYTYLMQSLLSLTPEDSALFLQTLEGQINATNFSANRRVIDGVGIYNQTPVYPEILNTQSSARFGNVSNTEKTIEIESVITDNTFKIFPNPAKDKLFINLEKLHSEIALLEIFDASGKLQFSLQLNSLQNTVDINKLISGNYRIRITNGTQVINEKLQVIK